MFGFFGDFGGDADVEYVKDLIEKKKAERRGYLKKMWTSKIFTKERRSYEIKANQARLELKALYKKLRLAKRGEYTKPSTSSTATTTTLPGLPFAVPTAPKTSGATMPGLTAAQRAKIEQIIADMLAKGADADTAEETAKAKVLPPHLVRAYPRGFFRGVRRAGPRPVLPPTVPLAYRPMPGEFAPPSRDIDPLVIQRSIDPRFVARNLGPFPPGMSIDPMVPQVGLVPEQGKFTVPTSEEADMDTDAEESELSGGFDLKSMAANPLVLGGLALAALFVVPKLLGGKKSASVKSNPRRHRKHRKNRRSRRSHR